MIRHLVWALEPERLKRCGAGHAYHFDDRLLLPPSKELKINHGLYMRQTC